MMCQMNWYYDWEVKHSKLKLYKKCKMRCISFLKSKGYSLNIYVSFRLTNKAYLSLAQDQYEGLSKDQTHYTVIMVC